MDMMLFDLKNRIGIQFISDLVDFGVIFREELTLVDLYESSVTFLWRWHFPQFW